MKDRKVALYRKKNGDKKKLGSDQTNAKGKFSIGVGGGPKNGKYFAEAGVGKASVTAPARARNPQRSRSADLRHGVAAGLYAAVLSGAPSTAHALATRGDALEASLAAGSILLGDEERRSRLLLAAVPVHLALSLGWATAISLTAPRGHELASGVAAGAAIAALDLGLIGRRFPRIGALPLAPQVAEPPGLRRGGGRGYSPPAGSPQQDALTAAPHQRM